MNSEPNLRQTSLRSFFGYLTLACIALGATQSDAFRADPALAFLLFAITCSAVGAALGSLFGRAEISAAIVAMVIVAGRCVLSLLDVIQTSR
jgi:hypothetical protein